MSASPFVDPRGPVSEPRIDLGPFSGAEAVVRPWAWTLDALRRTQKFTVCTVRADGRPHAVPLLAVWSGQGMFFCCGRNEQKAKNLDAEPRCLLRCGSDGLTGFDYVVEGTTEQQHDPAVLDAVAAAYEDAYGWHVTRPDGTWHAMPPAIRAGELNVYALRPRIVFAFDNGEPFGETRYHFDD